VKNVETSEEQSTVRHAGSKVRESLSHRAPIGE
jgi:hypothetical protein